MMPISCMASYRNSMVLWLSVMLFFSLQKKHFLAMSKTLFGFPCDLASSREDAICFRMPQGRLHRPPRDWFTCPLKAGYAGLTSLINHILPKFLMLLHALTNAYLRSCRSKDGDKAKPIQIFIIFFFSSL